MRQITLLKFFNSQNSLTKAFIRFPFKRFRIINQSMEPLISDNSEVITFSYLFSKPKIGDIIVFNHNTPPFIFCKKITRVLKNKVWVEGENRKISIDSRKFGYVSKSNIEGKVILKY